MFRNNLEVGLAIVLLILIAGCGGDDSPGPGNVSYRYVLVGIVNGEPAQGQMGMVTGESIGSVGNNPLFRISSFRLDSVRVDIRGAGSGLYDFGGQELDLDISAVIRPGKIPIQLHGSNFVNFDHIPNRVPDFQLVGDGYDITFSATAQITG